MIATRCYCVTYHTIVVVKLIVEHSEVRVREQIQLALSCGLGATVYCSNKATDWQVIFELDISLVRDKIARS